VTHRANCAGAQDLLKGQLSAKMPRKRRDGWSEI
jgi:hypothetical protein